MRPGSSKEGIRTATQFVLGFLPVIIRDWERLVSKDRAYGSSVSWYKVR
jgi:hypothetical protein